MSLFDIGPNTTTGEILSAYPSAKLGLFRRYHVGGCSACGYQPTDTLAEVCREHNITDPLDTVIACIRESQEVEAKLQILPTVVAATLKPEEKSQLVDVQWPEVAAALQHGENLRLVDVRSREEWNKAHIPGAELLTLELTFEALDSWPKNTPIIFYSNTGGRSLEKASYFMAYGFTNVRNMAGGLEAWAGEVEPSCEAPLTASVPGTKGPEPGT